jgi:hypothetical protein
MSSRLFQQQNEGNQGLDERSINNWTHWQFDYVIIIIIIIVIIIICFLAVIKHFNKLTELNWNELLSS